MSQFLRILSSTDKAEALLSSCTSIRQGKPDSRCFEIAPHLLDSVPGKPFAYWISDGERECFEIHPPLESDRRKALGGLKTLSDERFLRCWWECDLQERWLPIAKGGSYSPYYADLPLVVNWAHRGLDISWYGYLRRPREGFGGCSRGIDYYFHPGVTWGRRTQVFGPKILPKGCIFSDKGPAAFVMNDGLEEILALTCILNSQLFGSLLSVLLARVELAQSFEVGLIQQTPVPLLTPAQQDYLSGLARRAWSLKRSLDTVNEISHAFALPAALRPQLGALDPPAIDAELARIQAEIDDIAFDLYGFSDADRAAATQAPGSEPADSSEAATDDEDDEAEADTPAASANTLLSWAVGVAFGRFDWRLATGERAAPPEPEPFDPLPALSPGMLPVGAAPFHAHGGILVDDPGHAHDLARLVDDVLGRVNQSVPDDLRRWLQREFFAFHLQRYSKSRRKAPIYWPLATASGNYTLWLYYPSLTSQTFYTAINDFVEPKLAQVTGDAAALRSKGAARSRDEEKRFETLEAFELELIELRDTLLKIAPTFKPDHDDGVQISAAPLWPLFRHKPWQKVLKDTWAKLEKGDYDWAHLAMNYWPDRVRDKCKADKSLAIAHGLEQLYVEPEAKPKKIRVKKNTGA